MHQINTKINLGDINIHYKHWGGSGQQIFLLHGLASNLQIWNLVAPNLVAKGYSVVAIDQRGHGLSGQPSQGYDFDTISNDAVRTMAYMNLDNPIVIGHSWGGNVAVHIGAHFPDRIRGICLIDGGLIEISRIPDNTLKKSLKSMSPPNFEGWKKKDLIDRLKGRDWGERDSYSKKVNLDEIVLSNFRVDRNDNIAPKFHRSNHLKVISAFWDHKPTELFSSITVPTLIMLADKKESETSVRRTTRDEVLDLAESLIAQCETIRLSQTIHDVPLQRPLLVAEILLKKIEEGFFGPQ